MSDVVTEVPTERYKSHIPPAEHSSVTITGFWLYLMTDCVLFASLFATYAVLRANTNGGPNAQQLFDLNYVLAETLILLTSSFTCGLAMLAVQARVRRKALIWLGVTCLLGLAFITLEVHEFSHLVHAGDSWRRSGFLSSYFTLVGTHGLHVSIGLLWMVVLMWQLWRRDFTAARIRRLTCLSMFWHFLDLIWIFIFTIVYLVGVMR